MSTETAINVEIWPRLQILAQHQEFMFERGAFTIRTFTLDFDTAEPIELDCASIPDEIGMRFTVPRDRKSFITWNRHEKLIEFGLTSNIKLVNVRLDVTMDAELTDSVRRGKWIVRDPGALFCEPKEEVVSGEIYPQEGLIFFWPSHPEFVTFLMYAE